MSFLSRMKVTLAVAVLWGGVGAGAQIGTVRVPMSMLAPPTKLPIWIPCVAQFNPAQPDTDHDGLIDSCDLCPQVSAASLQFSDLTDLDQDGIGDNCDVCPPPLDDMEVYPCNQVNGMSADWQTYYDRFEKGAFCIPLTWQNQSLLDAAAQNDCIPDGDDGCMPGVDCPDGRIDPCHILNCAGPDPVWIVFRPGFEPLYTDGRTAIGASEALIRRPR